jgi:hypothetical protein
MRVVRCSHRGHGHKKCGHMQQESECDHVSIVRVRQMQFLATQRQLYIFKGVSVICLCASRMHAQLTHVFDNDATVVYALVMSLWASLFLVSWKRYRYHLACRWDLLTASNDKLTTERVRPEYDARARSLIRGRLLIDPITKESQPYLPFEERWARLISSSVAVLFLVGDALLPQTPF